MQFLSYIVTAPGITRDLSLPHICVSNNVKNATIAASSAFAGFPADSIKSPPTYSGWQPSSSTSDFIITFSPAISVNYFGMFMRGKNISITVSYSIDGTNYTSLGEKLTSTDGAILFLSEQVNNVVKIKVEFSGGQPVVYNASAGLAFIPENGLSDGFAPSHLNYRDDYSNTESEGGQILGRSVIRTSQSEQVQISSIERSWVDTNWINLRELLRSNAAYVAWNPSGYPNEVIYGMTDSNPQVSYSDAIFMDMSLSFKGPSNL